MSHFFAGLISRVKAIPLAILFLAFVAQSASANCDFRGLTVGDKISARELMAKLKVGKYLTNPNRDDYSKDFMDLAKKYGGMAAGEVIDERIGPYCTEKNCQGHINIGLNDSIPAMFSISMQEGKIIEIVIKFPTVAFEEILQILKEKYPAQWIGEHEDGGVVDYETKKSYNVPFINYKLKNLQINNKNGAKCRVWVSNSDFRFTHHNALGLLQGEYVIQLGGGDL